MTEPGSPLRIAVYHDLPSGGAKRTVHAQVRELVRRGHQVECFVTSTAEEDFLPLAEVAHRMTTLTVPDPPDREKALAGRPSPADLIRWARVYRGIRKAATEAAIDVAHGEFDVLLVHPSQFIQAPHILRRSAVPTVYYCHEVLRAAYEPGISPPVVRFAIRVTLGRIDRRNARSASTIVTNSAYTGRRVREVYGQDSTVVPPGVETSRFRPREGPRENYLLAVGALHPLKGMDFVVQALGRLSADRRPPLVMVSDRARDRERDRILKQAAELDVEIDLRQRVTEEELSELYRRARGVLFAPHGEPLGLVSLEAMACGTPVVAVDEGGIPEAVVDGETGFLTPRDPDRFADRVLELLRNPDMAEEMGQRGRRHVEARWTWRQSVDGLEAVIRRTVDEQRSGPEGI